MRRAFLASIGVVAALAVACLETNPDQSYLAPLDENPPRVVRVEPTPDGGTPVLSAGEAIKVTFSELMDVRSLRPGIAFIGKGVEQRLVITVPPPEREQVQDKDFEYTVTVQPVAEDGMSPVPSGVYSLLLRTLLTDVQGNALPSERRVVFDVR
ncbi:MAG: Ig-like domain-containing protein [Myxococcota bacterium]